MERWQVVVEFAPLAKADAQWTSWCASHDATTLAESDVRIDTGHGFEGDVRRYSVLETAMASIRSSERTEAIEFLNKQGVHAFARDWVLGQTIGVAAEPFEHRGIRGWKRMVYIAPENLGWLVHDLSKPGEPATPVTSIKDACDLALSSLRVSE